MAKSSKGKGKTAPEGETKAQKFIRLGSARVTKAIKAIDQIGNLAGAGYERTSEQVTKIFDAIGAATDRAEERFKAPSGKAIPDTFQL